MATVTRRVISSIRHRALCQELPGIPGHSSWSCGAREDPGLREGQCFYPTRTGKGQGKNRLMPTLRLSP